MITLTDEQVLETLTAMVAADPGFQYVRRDPFRKCTYVYGGKPDCGVGRWLDIVGVDLTTLPGFANTQSFSGLMMCTDLGLRISDRSVQLLAMFQYQQDKGQRWDECLRIAIAAVEGYKELAAEKVFSIMADQMTSAQEKLNALAQSLLDFKVSLGDAAIVLDISTKAMPYIEKSYQPSPIDWSSVQIDTAFYSMTESPPCDKVLIPA